MENGGTGCIPLGPCIRDEGKENGEFLASMSSEFDT